jgi:2-phospho-L-lactate guanylyltransferase
MRPIWIIIPAQSFDKSKTRLAPVLDVNARRRFSRDCLVHVVRTARGLVSARRIVVVSRAAEVLGLARRLGVHALAESGGGLNRAVTEASAFARERGAMATLVLHADLPGMRTKDIRRLLWALTRHEGVVLAPDEGREGSNALGLRPPGAIPYRFGPDSFNRHRAEARSARRFVHIINEMGLARDIDTPENFRVFSNQGKRPG